MSLQKFHTEAKFGLIDLHSMAGPSGETMHSSGARFVNTTDEVQLEIGRAPNARAS